MPASVTASPRPPDAQPSRAVLPDGTATTLHALRPHLDRSRALVGVSEVRHPDGTALTGRGALVGLVDSGVDVSHPDLRTADGRTRIAWHLDYTRAPLGLHPALEARFAVDTPDGRRGAVRSADDLDRALALGDAPIDRTGHGTHALSIALGTGGSDARYVGLAPGATALVVNASLSDRSPAVSEELASLGARFLDDRATFMAMPLVISLSLGTHRGAHDGDGDFERALAAIVRDGDAPGRAVVASAGNGAGRRLHASVTLVPGARRALTIRTQGPWAGVVGVTLAARAPFAVTAQWSDGRTLERAPAGTTRAGRNPDTGAQITVAHESLASPHTGSRVAFVTLDGPGDLTTLWLEGEGPLDAWIDRDGNASTLDTLPHFVAPDGDERATVEIPATSPAVLAVGARSTRAAWLDALGVPHTRTSPEGVTAPFSARGPTPWNALKPDLTAPGDVVIAALSAQARDATVGPFATPALHVDASHAVGIGTSAAAPHVAGVIALLFELAPRATQRALSAALTASSSPWNAADGWSTLHAPGALAALTAGPLDRASPTHTICVPLASPLTHFEASALACRALDRDEHPALATLTLTSPTRLDVGTARDLGGGRYVLPFTAPPSGDRLTLTVSVDGVPLAPLEIPLRARDHDAPLVSSGGCAVHPCHRGFSAAWWAMAACLLARGSARRSPRAGRADRARRSCRRGRAPRS